ncbi:MAG: hypothetical protein ACK4HW_01055 [Roseinatronobacter sp.]
MTALKKYAKLEGLGLWAPTRPDQRREVIVSLGDATLVMMDARSQIVLSHWSLAAVERLNPGKMPAVYSPDADHDETLELDDPLLIEALETLRAALDPPPGLLARLRRAALVGAVAVTAGLAVFVVPSALVEHTTSVVPLAKRTELGEAMLADLSQTGVRVCTGGLGTAALAALYRRVIDGPGRFVVIEGLDTPNPRVQHMPGRLYVIDARLLDTAEAPEELEAAILLAVARHAAEDPLRPLLRYAGSVATFRLLTSGDLPLTAMRGYALALLRATPRGPSAEGAVAQFQRVGLSPRAFLIASTALDPARDALAPSLRALDLPETGGMISDGQWVSLLNLCAE